MGEKKISYVKERNKLKARLFVFSVSKPSYDENLKEVKGIVEAAINSVFENEFDLLHSNRMDPNSFTEKLQLGLNKVTQKITNIMLEPKCISFFNVLNVEGDTVHIVPNASQSTYDFLDTVAYLLSNMADLQAEINRFFCRPAETPVNKLTYELNGYTFIVTQADGGIDGLVNKYDDVIRDRVN